MSKKTILLVEDDTVVREMIKDVLKREYRVLEASGYSEAAELFNYHIDLALIDYVLPDGDGFEVLKAIREAKPLLPAIIMTAYSNEKVMLRAIRTEVADYIKKPLKLAYLRKRLSDILGEKKNNKNQDITNENNKNFEGFKSRKEFILDSVAAYLEEKYMKDLPLDKVAGMACMNIFNFSKAFKKRFGQSFISYLNSIRIRNAAALLKKPHLTIAEIARFVGYRSVTHFDRMFRAVHSITPSEYREMIKKSQIKNKKNQK